MTIRARRRRHPRRKTLFVETLEPRIVLDRDLTDAVTDLPDAIAPAIEQFESAAELRQFLLVFRRRSFPNEIKEHTP